MAFAIGQAGPVARLPQHEVQHPLSLKHGRARDAQELQDGGGHVHEAYLLRHDLPCESPPDRLDDQGDKERGVVDEVAVGPLRVLSEAFPVISRHQDGCRSKITCLFA